MEAPRARRYILAMKCVQRLLAAAFVVLALANQGVIAAEAVRAEPPAAPRPTMRIGPGDQVKVDVFGNPDLSTVTNVTDEGTLRMPLAGDIKVTGQSSAEAARRIEAAMKDGGFLVNPQVNVTVVQSLSQRVTVMGEVGQPGRYPIESNSTVSDLIALAGGITEKGADRLYILRPDAAGVLQRVSVDIRPMAGPQVAGSAAIETLRGGDTVVVPKGTYTIIGQVTQPGEHRIEGEMVLFEAIARAGGVTPMGSASRVEVRRRGPNDQYVKVKINKDLRIEPGDVITVKERLF